MEGTHGTDVSALVGASLTASQWIAVNRDGLKGECFLAAKEGAEGDQAVPEGVQKPLLPDPPGLCTAALIGVTGAACHRHGCAFIQ